MITTFHDKVDPEAQAKFERWRQMTSHGYYINYRSRSNMMIHRVGCPHDTPWHPKWGSLTKMKKMCSSCCGQGKTDTQLSNPSQFFVCIRTDIPKIRVLPSTVVEHLNVSDDIVSGLLTRGVRPMHRPFAF